MNLDSISTPNGVPSIEEFQASVSRLEQAAYFAHKMALHWKTVAGVQWMIGNIAIIIVAIVGFFAYRFVNKALKAFTEDKEYVLPRRWIVIYWTTVLLVIGAFNLLPATLEPDLPKVKDVNLEAYP